MPTEDLTLDELNYIMNLQRQEAFDDAVKEDNETAEDKLQKILKAPNYSSSSMSDLPVFDMPKDKSEKEKRRIRRTKSHDVRSMSTSKPMMRRSTSSSRNRPGKPRTDSRRSGYASSKRKSGSLRSLQKSLQKDAESVSSNDTGSRKDKVSMSSGTSQDSSHSSRGSSLKRGRRPGAATNGRKESGKKKTGRSKSRDGKKHRSKSKDGKKHRSKSRSKNPPETTDEKKFEQVWGSERKLKDGLPSSGADDLAPESTGTLSNIRRALTGDSSKVRKTKLEKIHELQAKCDRYKNEWVDASKEKKRYRKQVQDMQVDVIALSKEIETHMAEIVILRKQLTETMEKLDETQADRQRERDEYSTTADELAQSRIEYTKSLNVTRELQTEVEKLEASLTEKDVRIETLTDELQDAQDQIEDLNVDLRHADEEAIKLEREMTQITEEINLYKEAAEKDEEEGSAENLRKARSDMEKRMHDERERRLEEKQRKLDEKLKAFEEEREKALQRQQTREEEFSKRQVVESEKQKEREDQRKELDDTISQRLKELEDTNTVLQGKLKSEQLESTRKIKKRDENIKSLETGLEEVKKQLAERDADPEGIIVLQREVETAKAEANAAREDLAEAQRLNGMLEEEIEDLQAGTSQLRQESSTYHDEASASKSEIEKLRKKVEEWQKKSSEWTDKAFLWKDKAEYWEKTAREIDPYYKDGGMNVTAEKPEDPQALFLQSAVQKKKASETNPQGGWGWGGMNVFNKNSEDQSESRLQELKDENANQADIIKTLRSEIVRLQSRHKEEIYRSQQQVVQVERDMESVELKNVNLMKELELARKLDRLSIQEE